MEHILPKNNTIGKQNHFFIENERLIKIIFGGYD